MSWRTNASVTGFADGVTVSIGTVTGTIFGASGSKIGFFGTTAVVRPAAYTLTFATAASRTLAADTTVDPAATAATNVTPFGYTTAAQADAIRAAVIAVHADLDNTKQVVKQLITDLKALGLLQ